MEGSVVYECERIIYIEHTVDNYNTHFSIQNIVVNKKHG